MQQLSDAVVVAPRAHRGGEYESNNHAGSEPKGRRKLKDRRNRYTRWMTVVGENKGWFVVMDDETIGCWLLIIIRSSGTKSCPERRDGAA